MDSQIPTSPVGTQTSAEPSKTIQPSSPTTQAEKVQPEKEPQADILAETAREANDLQTRLAGWLNCIWPIGTPAKTMEGDSVAWLLGVPYHPVSPSTSPKTSHAGAERKPTPPSSEPAKVSPRSNDEISPPSSEPTKRSPRSIDEISPPSSEPTKVKPKSMDETAPEPAKVNPGCNDETPEIEKSTNEEANETRTPPYSKSSHQRLLPKDFYLDFYSRLWFTYRTNYAAIRPSAYTSDVGWGCMLRSGQALLAQTLLLHFLGRGWRRVPKSENERWRKYAQIVISFLDEFSARSPFSIHRIALLGKQYEKDIGQWFGPSTISQVIKVLVTARKEIGMAVHVVTDGVVYRNEIFQACREAAGGDSPQSADANNDAISSPILILISIRLGIDNLNPVYYPALKTYFTFPQSVGIAGGRPCSSLYFVGYEGDQLFYLDPHYARPIIETKLQEEYTEKDFASFHCETVRRIRISQLDPSMLLGFYCRNQEDYDNFTDRVNAVAKEFTPVFSVGEVAPRYEEMEDLLNGTISDADTEEGIE